MSCNEILFENLHTLDVHGYVQIDDDTKHRIQHVGNIPFTKYLWYKKFLVRCVTCSYNDKYLISIGQMEEKGLRVRFT